METAITLPNRVHGLRVPILTDAGDDDASILFTLSLPGPGRGMVYLLFLVASVV